MPNKINLLRFLIVVLFFSSIAIATETTWRHSGFEISGYDINGSSTYNLTEIRKIEFGWNTSIPAVSETNRAVMYYDDNQKQIMQSVNGGTYQAIVTNETVRPYSYNAANATGVLPNASIPASALNITSMTGLGSIYPSTDQLNIPSATYTKVVLNTVLYGSACATNGNCTAPVSGIYTISGNAHFYNTVADKRLINNIYVNEAFLQEYYAQTSIGGAGDAFSLGFTKTIHLNAGDRVAMYVWQNDGTSTTDIIGAMTYLQMTLERMD